MNCNMWFLQSTSTEVRPDKQETHGTSTSCTASLSEFPFGHDEDQSIDRAARCAVLGVVCDTPGQNENAASEAVPEVVQGVW